MTAKEILAEIKPLGSESYKRVLMNNHGVKEPCFGVKISELKKIPRCRSVTRLMEPAQTLDDNHAKAGNQQRYSPVSISLFEHTIGFARNHGHFPRESGLSNSRISWEIPHGVQKMRCSLQPKHKWIPFSHEL
jgi:hypothetical protein